MDGRRRTLNTQRLLRSTKILLRIHCTDLSVTASPVRKPVYGFAPFQGVRKAGACGPFGARTSLSAWFLLNHWRRTGCPRSTFAPAESRHLIPPNRIRVLKPPV